MVVRILSIFLLSLFASAGTLACSCGGPGPIPCTGLNPSEVLFVGTVVRIDNPASYDDGLGGGGEAHYRFHVDEKLAGTQEPDIDIFSGRGTADCSYHFQQGQQYLVSPYRNKDGRLFAIICSITRPVELALGLLPELRARRDHQRVASLYGTLRAAEEPYLSVSDDMLGKPLPNTRVELRSTDHVFDARTDSNGVYAFYGVPAGEYNITAELPKNLEPAQMILNDPLPPLKLPGEVCYEYDVSAYPTGSIRGRVLGPDGKPLAYAPLELFRPEKYSPKYAPRNWMESQDREKGYFEFAHVGPGDYILVYNVRDEVSTDSPYHRTFYPGVSDLDKAERIHVAAGERVTGVDIRVAGGKPIRLVSVRLVAEIGKLPDIHYVEARGEDGSELSEQETSPAVYEISLFKNLRYEMHGEGYCSATQSEARTDSVEVDGADDTTTEVTLTFRGYGCKEGKPTSD